MASKTSEAKSGRISSNTSKSDRKVVAGGLEARKKETKGKSGENIQTNGKTLKEKEVDKMRCELNDWKESANNQRARDRASSGKWDKEWTNDNEEKNEEKRNRNKSAIKHSEQEKNDRAGVQKGGGERGMVSKKEREEKGGTSSKVKGTADAKGLKQSAGSKALLDVGDYQTLLKLLKITLPKGVLNPTVIKISTNPSVIKDAKVIIEDLEHFKLQFVAKPRLRCREVKRAVDLKNSSKALEITRIIFFEHTKDSEKTLKEGWQWNSSNTGHGFRMRDRYTTTPISTPLMYNTAVTRSWSREDGEGEVRLEVTQGMRVTMQDLEKMKFSVDSEEISRQKRDAVNEMDCLKFFHELREISSENEHVIYTRGNKVEFGFLSGKLDFLAVITRNRDSKNKSHSISNVIIECKGTDGDMVGKLFTKPSEGNKAEFVNSHEHCFQTQAYAYILKKAQPSPALVRAVMVVRHYHSDGSRFYWNYLKEDHSKQINELKDFCQEEVLARFLAVLHIIFQKEP